MLVRHFIFLLYYFTLLLFPFIRGFGVLGFWGFGGAAVGGDGGAE